jgi:outer membrane protein assembly factor BamB
MLRNGFLVLCCSLGVLGMAVPARAQLKAGPGDWPAWRGPDRTGVSTETGLLKAWPAGGPKLFWKVKGMGGGYSTPSVAAGRIYLMGSKGNDEYLIALDVEGGKQLWETKVGAVGKPKQIPPYPGSRSTPTVDGDRIYALASDGALACLDHDGKIIWHKHLVEDFGGSSGIWAYAESPLIDGDVLVCTPGGAKASLAALNKNTGEVLWKAEAPSAGEAGYASAVIAEAGGVRQYVNFLRNGVVSVAAKDGKFLWHYNKIATTTNCSTPITHDGYVFESGAGPGAGGCALLQLTPEGDGVSAKEVYYNRSLANHHGGVVQIGDSVYGTTGMELACLDFKTGEIRWHNPSTGKGSVTAADGHLYVRGEKGAVALVEATPSGYKETGRFEQPDRSNKPAWPYPVVAGGRLYLRDGDVLLCYDIKAN